MKDQDERLLDAADAALWSRLVCQPCWPSFMRAAHAVPVAIIGAGPSIEAATVKDLHGAGLVISCNNAAQIGYALAKQAGIPHAAFTTDPMPEPQITVPADHLFVAESMAKQYPAHPSIVTLADMPYVTPMSAAAHCVWLARMAFATKAIMVACDSILGDNSRWQAWASADYLWHPACAVAMARGLPLQWVCPGRSVPVNPPMHPCPLRKT